MSKMFYFSIIFLVNSIMCFLYMTLIANFTILLQCQCIVFLLTVNLLAISLLQIISQRTVRGGELSKQKIIRGSELFKWAYYSKFLNIIQNSNS